MQPTTLPLTALLVTALFVGGPATAGGFDPAPCLDELTVESGGLGGGVSGSLWADDPLWMFQLFAYDFLVPDKHVVIEVAAMSQGQLSVEVYEAGDICGGPTKVPCQNGADGVVPLAGFYACVLDPASHFIKIQALNAYDSTSFELHAMQV